MTATEVQVPTELITLNSIKMRNLEILREATYEHPSDGIKRRQHICSPLHMFDVSWRGKPSLVAMHARRQNWGSNYALERTRTVQRYRLLSRDHS